MSVVPGPAVRERAVGPEDDAVSAVPVLDARLLPATLTCWLVTILAVGAGWVVGVVVALGLALLALASWGLLWTGIARRGERRRVVATVVLGAALIGSAFACTGAWREYRVGEHPLRSVPAAATVDVVMEPGDDPKPVRSSGSGAGRLWVVRGELREFRYRDRVVRGGGAVVVLAAGPAWAELLPGRPIEFRARPAPARQRDLTVVTLRPVGEPAVVGPLPWWQAAADSVRSDLVAAAGRALAPAPAGLLPALVVGDTSALSDRVHDDFVTAGLQHLTVVSGANFTILLTVVLATTRLLTLGPRLSLIGAGIALVSFVIIARPDPSVLRAAAMGSVTLLALLTGRRKQALPALCAAVIVLLALWPALAVQAGFALSVLATGALLLLAPSWADHLRAHGWWRLPAELVAVAAAAFAVTTPVTVALSGRLSLVAVAANILVAPVIAPITIGGALAAVAATCWGSLAQLILRTTGPPLWWLLTVATEAAAVPGAEVTVPGGSTGGLLAAVSVAGGIVALRLPRVRRILVAMASGLLAAYLLLLRLG
ncbi:ComEC/Rec2 family competence protein [Nocardia sp. NBC_01329]|uniref:ComEC/Rec2 family competence protein n=1 Tax=Nocardia sp. NBC_01329 TaxID=2903594 RepID=UPI002E1020AC|nr:ComEC/Rec2 family competence protein [Nocardia sp. NBC_01329]